MKCAWCPERFRPARSDQKYCCGSCRRAACERRKLETERALVGRFATYGVPIEWLRDYAERYPEATKSILQALDYVYDERARCWQRQPRLPA